MGHKDDDNEEELNDLIIRKLYPAVKERVTQLDKNLIKVDNRNPGASSTREEQEDFFFGNDLVCFEVE